MKSITYAFLVKLLRAESTSLALLRHQCTALEDAKIDHKIYKKGHKDKDLYDQKDQREKMIKRQKRSRQSERLREKPRMIKAIEKIKRLQRQKNIS